jgi:hypothetical protein
MFNFKNLLYFLGACIIVLPLLGLVPFVPDDKILNPPDEPIPNTLFGLHIHRIGAGTEWPSIPFGGWRLWDARVAWSQVETKPGNYDWKLLDHYVEVAKEKHLDLMYELGGYSPSWRAARKDEKIFGEAYKGYASEPIYMNDWKSWVQTVSSRYKGKIRFYEIWNEPDMKGFKSPQGLDKMVEMSRIAYETIKKVDSNSLVLSPAFGTAQGLLEFLQRGGGKYCDIIAYHFYVGARPPEVIIKRLADVQEAMEKTDVHKPVWNTEAGWENGTMDSENSAAYLARFYILNWALGIKRCYIYAWDNQRMALHFLANSGSGTTPAATAYSEINNWLVGAMMISCEAKNGLWMAQITRPGGYKGRIIWTVDKNVSFKIPSQWHANYIRKLDGEKKSVATTPTPEISTTPILIETQP